MKRKSFRGLASALSLGALSTIFLTGSTPAATYTKADNTTTLDLAGSWGGTAPGSGDLANWSGTYNTAGSLAAALPASVLSWQGITSGTVSGKAVIVAAKMNMSKDTAEDVAAGFCARKNATGA